MASPQYSSLVLDHFTRPRNVGSLPSSDDVVTGRAGSREQGVSCQISARLRDDQIAEVRFQMYGCPHCIAAASWLSERLPGSRVQDLEAWSWREAAGVLDVPPEKRGRLLVLEDALRALAANWRARSSDS
jgi:NifU-like protein involved in Fe-S cluster formation